MRACVCCVEAVLPLRNPHDADGSRLYTWFNDHRPALVQPRSTQPGSRGMRDDTPDDGGAKESDNGGRGGRAALAEGETSATVVLERGPRLVVGGGIEGYVGGLAKQPERPTGQFRLELRGRRATGRLSAPFFRYSFISFRFSSSSVPID